MIYQTIEPMITTLSAKTIKCSLRSNICNSINLDTKRLKTAILR